MRHGGGRNLHPAAVSSAERGGSSLDRCHRRRNNALVGCRSFKRPARRCWDFSETAFSRLTELVNQGRLLFPRQMLEELERVADQAAPDQQYLWAKRNQGTACLNAPSLDSVKEGLAVVPRVLDPHHGRSRCRGNGRRAFSSKDRGGPVGRRQRVRVRRHAFGSIPGEGLK